MKFSIIIPVYNKEMYIKKCLDSIINQNYDNYEIIIVNDGSTDNSQEIVEGYAKNNSNIKLYTQKNGGVSKARNLALEKVTGDYLLFLDADDYLSQDYFKNVDSYLGKNKNIDILRIQANLVDEEFNLIGKTDGHEFKNLSGEDAFKIFVTEKMFDMPCVYIYQTDFWKKHDFRFVVGKIHEDFELIPKTILLANCVSSVKMYLYNYVQVSNSIVHNVSIESRKKRVYDQLSHYDSMCSFINSSDVSASTRKIFMSFISNSVIDKAQELEGNDLKEYIKKLKERKVQKNLLDNSVLRFLKKLLVSLNIKLYIKFFVKR